jgi:hypothetical protein
MWHFYVAYSSNFLTLDLVVYAFTGSITFPALLIKIFLYVILVKLFLYKYFTLFANMTSVFCGKLSDNVDNLIN